MFVLSGSRQNIDLGGHVIVQEEGKKSYFYTCLCELERRCARSRVTQRSSGSVALLVFCFFHLSLSLEYMIVYRGDAPSDCIAVEK